MYFYSIKKEKENVQASSKLGEKITYISGEKLADKIYKPKNKVKITKIFKWVKLLTGTS